MTGFDYFKRFLQDEGFRPKEEDGFASFKFEGTSYFLVKNESAFVQVVVVCNTEKYDRIKVLEVCNKLNADKFVTKFVVNDKTVWCSYEFSPSEHTSTDEYSMILSLLEKNSDELFQRLDQA